MASELGRPGAAAVRRLRRRAPWSRRCAPAGSGPRRRPSSPARSRSAAYWLVHASVEWFWSYPALTLPMAFALGAAAAPALLRPGARATAGPRAGGLAVAAGARGARDDPVLAQRALHEQGAARAGAPDLPGAYADLERAADLNPFSDRPLAAEAVIAEEAGEPQRALAALAEAQERQPDEWTLYYLEARVLGRDRPGRRRAGARREPASSTRDGAEIAELEQELASARAGSAACNGPMHPIGQPAHGNAV